MALYPAAVKRLIPPGSNDPRIKPRVAILHVDAGNNRDLHDFFRYRSGGIESHFQVAADGTVFQYRDTDFEADANHKANPFAVSIETQGLGEGEWTPQQLKSIMDLLVWLYHTHGIPLRKVRRWNGSGVGYHVQFGAPGAWTPVAKSCPGPKRITQFHTILMPWMRTAHKKTPPARRLAPAVRRFRAELDRALRDIGAPGRRQIIRETIRKFDKTIRKDLR